MTSVKLKLNRDRVLRDGTYPLVFQLIRQRRKKLIYTPFKLCEEEFDEEHGKVLCLSGGLRSPGEVRRMNRDIAQQRRSIDRHIETLELRRENYTAADVVFRYRVEHDGLSLLHYMDRQIGERERSERITRNSSPKIRALIKAAFDSTPDRSNISSSRMYSSSVKLTEQRRTAGSDLGGRPPRPRLCGFSVSAITANFIPCGRVKIPIRRHAPSS